MTLTTDLTRPEPKVAPTASSVRALVRTAGRYDGPRDIDGQLRVASALAQGRAMIQQHFIGSPGDVLAGLYQAMALDIGVMTAMTQLHVETDDNNEPIPGRCGMSGTLMLALLLRAGHRVIVEQSDEHVCRMRLDRADGMFSDAEPVEWTLVEAQRAEIADRRSWKMFPSDMLYWRCLARLARRFASDVVLGLGYVPEELADTAAAIGGSGAAEEPREVAADVQELLADVDTLDYDGLRALWPKARKAGLLDRYAGNFGGVAYTVETLLQKLAADALPDPDEETAEPAGEPAPVAEPAAAAEETEPAAEGDKLSCGHCLVSEFIQSGQHRADCPQRELWGDEGESAAADQGDEDVLAVVLDCGCLEAMVNLSGGQHSAVCRDRGVDQ